MKFIRGLIFVLLCALLVVARPESSRAELLEGCIRGYDFGDQGDQSLEVTPIQPECYTQCRSACQQALSRKSPPNTNGFELNKGPIARCSSDCRYGGIPQVAGNTTARSYLIREDRGTPPPTNITSANQMSNYNSDIVYTTVPVSQACAEDIRVMNYSDAKAYDTSYNFSGANKTQIYVNAGDTINVDLTAGEQKVYMCGKDQVVLIPTISSLNPADWNNSTSQTIWKSKNQHICYALMDDTAFSSLTNQKLWGTSSNDICAWHAKNPNPVNTGLFVQNGDDLTISWSSTINSQMPGVLSAFFPYPLDRKSIFEVIMNPSSAAVQKIAADIFQDMGSLYIYPMIWDQQSYKYKISKPSNIDAEKTRLPGQPDYITAVQNIGKLVNTGNSIPKPYKWNGLSGFFQDMNVKIQTKNTAKCQPDQITDYKSYNSCNDTTDPGYSYYSFSGSIDTGGNGQFALGIAHPPVLESLVKNQNDIPTLYGFQLGGGKVTIDWGGCPISDGAQLEFAVYDPDTKNIVQNWTPLTFTNRQATATAAAAGNLAFRIDLGSYFPVVADGSYTISVKVPSILSNTGYYKADGPLYNLVKDVHNTLYGKVDPKTKVRSGGVVEQMYDNVVRQTGFARIIQAFLTLYLAFAGLGFVLGTIELKQQDLINRAIKMAFVLVIIDPNSWQFFYTYFFSAAVDGSIELMAMIVTGSLDRFHSNQITSQFAADSDSVFAIFDGLISQMGSANMWKKIATLLFLGFIGFAMMLVIIIAIGIYVLAVLKAVLSYLMSLVIISVLLFVTPVFLPMILFQQTKSMFDTWWKMIVTFALQPVGLFAGIAIFNTLFAAALYATLSFTVCKYCAFALTIPGVDTWCIIKWWQPVADMFTPDNYQTTGFASVINLVEGALIMLILAHGMLKYCDFVMKMIGSIISGELTSRSLSLSGYSSQAGGMAVGAATTAMRAPVAVQQARAGAAGLGVKFQSAAAKARGQQRVP